MRLQKNISFRKADTDVYDYLTNKELTPDVSAYIVKLVRSDIENTNKNSNIDLSEVMKELHEIKEMIRNEKLSVSVTKKADKDDIESLMSIFGDDWNE